MRDGGPAMGAPEIVTRLRTAYQRWHDTRGRSTPEWLEMMADDVKLRSVSDGVERMEFSAPRNGKSELLDYFAALAADWEMLYHLVDEIISDGDNVVVFGRCGYRHRRTGKTVESPLIHRWRFRDGLVAEFYEFYDTAKGLAAATPD
jgi:ketosteroid isomerase-like protein